MGNYLLIGALIFGVMFGGLGTAKLSKLNPFKAKAGIVQKDEGKKEEFYKDKIKGIEYRSKETHKSQNKQTAANESSTFGSKVGNIIDTSWGLIKLTFFGGILLFVLTGINIFKYIKRAGKLAKDAVKEANRYRKGLKQTVKAIDKAKPRMNGEYELLAEELRDKHDDDTENLIREMKNE